MKQETIDYLTNLLNQFRVQMIKNHPFAGELVMKGVDGMIERLGEDGLAAMAEIPIVGAEDDHGNILITFNSTIRERFPYLQEASQILLQVHFVNAGALGQNHKTFIPLATSPVENLMKYTQHWPDVHCPFLACVIELATAILNEGYYITAADPTTLSDESDDQLFAMVFESTEKPYSMVTVLFDFNVIVNDNAAVKLADMMDNSKGKQQ